MKAVHEMLATILTCILNHLLTDLLIKGQFNTASCNYVSNQNVFYNNASIINVFIGI